VRQQHNHARCRLDRRLLWLAFCWQSRQFWLCARIQLRGAWLPLTMDDGQSAPCCNPEAHGPRQLLVPQDAGGRRLPMAAADGSAASHTFRLARASTQSTLTATVATGHCTHSKPGSSVPTCTHNAYSTHSQRTGTASKERRRSTRNQHCCVSCCSAACHAALLCVMLQSLQAQYNTLHA